MDEGNKAIGNPIVACDTEEEVAIVNEELYILHMLVMEWETFQMPVTDELIMNAANDTTEALSERLGRQVDSKILVDFIKGTLEDIETVKRGEI